MDSDILLGCLKHELELDPQLVPQLDHNSNTLFPQLGLKLRFGIGLRRPIQKPNLQLPQLQPQLHIITGFGGPNSQFEAKLRLELASSWACLKHLGDYSDVVSTVSNLSTYVPVRFIYLRSSMHSMAFTRLSLLAFCLFPHVLLISSSSLPPYGLFICHTPFSFISAFRAQEVLSCW